MWRMIKRYLKTKIFFMVASLFGIKFYVKQNYPPKNDGYDSFSFRSIPGSYFHGTYKEFENFHNGRRMKNAINS